MWKVLVKQGDVVEEGQLLCIIEAMKMENEITAHKAGKIVELPIEEGAAIQAGAPIATIVSEPARGLARHPGGVAGMDSPHLTRAPARRQLGLRASLEQRLQVGRVLSRHPLGVRPVSAGPWPGTSVCLRHERAQALQRPQIGARPPPWFNIGISTFDR